MEKIDAHHHCWIFNPERDSWMTDPMQTIRRNFLPADLYPELLRHNMDGSVLVQSVQSAADNDFLLELTADHAFIRGVVGWVDLQAENIHETLADLRRFPKIKGFRHILEAEKDRAFMLRPAFQRGIGALGKYGYTYDLLIRPDQLAYALTLVQTFPDQKFVLDHLGKPDIKSKAINDWKKEMLSLGRYENLYCKFSGMVTEANWNKWSAKEFIPYLDTVVEGFGIDRLLFGSDWPVCLLAGSYADMLQVVTEYFGAFSETEQAKLFGGNAINFYQLESNRQPNKHV